MKRTLNYLKPILSAKTGLALAMSMSLGFANAQSDSLGKFSFSGYADSYYTLNLNNPASGSNTGTSGFARAFDQKSNQFQLGLVQTKIGYKQRKSEVVADIVFGPNADLGNYGNTVGPIGGVTTTSLAIKQAYFVYNATEKLSFTAGQFGTHIGMEVIDAPINFHYSLSNLFNNGPFYHIGAKAGYVVSDKVSLMAGIVNNWDNLNDNNKQKSFIAQVSLAPAEGLTAYVNYIGGDEAKTGDPSQTKQMVDLVANYQLNDMFYIGLNAAQGFSKVSDEDTKYWGGAALYLNGTFSEKFALGLRAEHFDNTQGVQYIGNASVSSGTLTGRVTLADGHLILKPEFRYDMFSDEQFEDDKGAPKKSQGTLTLAAIYKF